MKKLIESLRNLCRTKKSLNCQDITQNINSTILGSWKLAQYIDSQGADNKPRWKEIWSFAAMDETETYGVYACDYINLYTIIGKWSLSNNRLALSRKECEYNYIVVELSIDKLVLKSDLYSGCEYFVFQRFV